MLAFVSTIALARFRRSGPRALLPLLLACGAAPAPGTAQAATLPLLPQPRAVVEKGAGFRLGEDVRLDIPRGEADAEHAAAWPATGSMCRGLARLSELIIPGLAGTTTS